MNAQEHWQHILLSNPQFRSNGRRGYDFRPVVNRRRSFTRIAWIVGLVVGVGIVVLIQQG